MKHPHAYQVDGASFLANGGCLLADEPGLGKTLQAIEACKRLEAKRVLIICPAVALAVWRDEITDCWSTCMPLYLRDTAGRNFFNGSAPFALITGYEYLLINDPAKSIIVDAAPFDVLICDEAHALKNPTAKRTMLIYGPGCAGGGIASLARNTMLLTGTPILNHPGEIFPHLRNLAPKRIDEKSYQGFTLHYCTTKIRYVRTKRGATKSIEVINGANRDELPELAKRLRGFWLRRKVEDVLTELPPITVSLRSLDPSLCDAEILKSVDESDEARLLTRALQTGDIEALREIEGQVSRIRRLFALAKVNATIAWVDDLLDQGVTKVGVWGWHVDALQRIARGLMPHGVAMITGETPTSRRAAIVKEFQEGSARVFVGQIQAAGTAITLTATHRAVAFEQAWTPAMNHQAYKRHHRIGQSKPVLIDVLAVDGSIDHAVNAILTRKADDIKLLEDQNEARDQSP